MESGMWKNTDRLKRVKWVGRWREEEFVWWEEFSRLVLDGGEWYVDGWVLGINDRSSGFLALFQFSRCAIMGLLDDGWVRYLFVVYVLYRYNDIYILRTHNSFWSWLDNGYYWSSQSDHKISSSFVHIYIYIYKITIRLESNSLSNTQN